MVRVARVHEQAQAILDELAAFPDPHDRLAELIRRAERRPGLSEAERSDEVLVRGCVSRVWLVGSLVDGRCHFRVAADSPMVLGLVGLLCDVYDGVGPAEAVAIDADVLARAGLDRSISPTRLHGLAQVRARIRAVAAAWAKDAVAMAPPDTGEPC